MCFCLSGSKETTLLFSENIVEVVACVDNPVPAKLVFSNRKEDEGNSINVGQVEGY